MSETAYKVDALREIVLGLSDEAIQAVYDFAAFLAQKELKRRAFIEETLRAKDEPTIRFDTIDDAVKAVFDEIQD